MRPYLRIILFIILEDIRRISHLFFFLAHIFPAKKFCIVEAVDRHFQLKLIVKGACQKHYIRSTNIFSFTKCSRKLERVVAACISRKCFIWHWIMQTLCTASLSAKIGSPTVHDATGRREESRRRRSDTYKCALNINPFERAGAMSSACPLNYWGNLPNGRPWGNTEVRCRALKNVYSQDAGDARYFCFFLSQTDETAETWLPEGK